MSDTRCPGRLEVSPAHSQGGWSSNCDVAVEVDCPERKCWWPGWSEPDRGDRKVWSIDQLSALQADHDTNATVGMPT